MQRTIRIPTGPGSMGQIKAVAVSPDGVTVAAGGWTSPSSGTQNIYLFELASGREIGRIGEVPNVIYYLAFSPDGSKLAAAIWAPTASACSCAVVARDSGGQRLRKRQLRCRVCTRRPIATTSYDGNIRLYGSRLDRRQTLRAPDGKRPYGIAFSPDGGRIAIGYDDTRQVTVLDGHTLSKLLLQT